MRRAKMCIAVLKSGDKKGSMCGLTAGYGSYCGKHKTASTDDYASAVVADQFYTRPETAEYCISVFLKHASFDAFDVIMEPSAGTGSFYALLPTAKRLGIDIDPKADGVLKQDFLAYSPTEAKYAIIGNPPFGRVSSLAISFFNKAATFARIGCVYPSAHV